MANYIKYAFQRGKAFDVKKAESIEEYLITAVKTHDYLESVKVKTDDGAYWAIQGNDEARGDFYMGSSGVVYFYLELYQATKDAKYLKVLEEGCDYLNRHWRETVDCAKAMMLAYGITEDTGCEYSYYTGVTGIAEVLSVVYRETGRSKELETVKAITDYLIKGLKTNKEHPHWALDNSMLYDAGPMIYLYHVSEILGDKKILDVANAVADGIVDKAIEDERGGYAWESKIHMGVDRVPNFEGGTAGIGFALTIAYQHTNNKKYLNAAVEAARHLRAIAIKQGEGFLIPWHDVPGEEPIFYVSSCHGPTGTSKLFYQLYEITKEREYLEDIKGLYRGLRALQVPEKMSTGYWNSVCVCCGTAGVLHFLIDCALVFAGDEFAKEAKETAILAADILLGEQELKVGGRPGVWPIAYERVKPENIAPDYGYFTGAAGIAASLLQIYLFLKGEFCWDRTIEDPYPSRAI